MLSPKGRASTRRVTLRTGLVVVALVVDDGDDVVVAKVSMLLELLLATAAIAALVVGAGAGVDTYKERAFSLTTPLPPSPSPLLTFCRISLAYE